MDGTSVNQINEMYTSKWKEVVEKNGELDLERLKRVLYELELKLREKFEDGYETGYHDGYADGIGDGESSIDFG